MLIHGSEENTENPNFDCDTCGEIGVPNKNGYSVVAQGATGRFCEVMWLCDTCGNNGGLSMSLQDARDKCNSIVGAYADF